ncbi:ApbE family protein [Treponema primitia ZAS-2]|uniref:FAD:protein FMN transferase n=1 Tax=Treponema primitia (strain ATCC BAA-887 / DSM 12427 / ZAS-2) TaxID=545694 RepID=F5YI25_TREPZ|nr:FAD:protein FMN transferase [Treponema primitia]AEF84867.1 ApbE family protein [Treponema primitia ZAS-2]
MNRYSEIIATLALTLIIATLPGCAKTLPSQSEFVLGTICTVNLYDQGSPEVYHQIFDRLREIENRMSANLEDSELDQINRMAGIRPVVVHPDLIDVIQRALYFAEKADGAFDPTVGPLVKLWSIGSDDERLPGEDEIAAALSLINWRDIVVDREQGTVFLERPLMRLDLGAIAKGYAADEAGRIIRAAGIKRALIDLGGNILALGEKKGGAPWRVGIQNPLDNRGAYFGIAEVRDKTLVTSGIYERFFEYDGKRYHHILSTQDGYPVDNGLLSITVISGNSIDADALSTSLFVLGYEQGKILAESLDDTEAIFVFTDMSVHCTSGALEYFTLTDTTFSLIQD